MTPTLAIVTPTGARPEAFDLCKRWIARQSCPPDQWIIVDNGKASLRDNILTAIPRIKSDYIAIIEDDDWYHEHYLEQVRKWLDRHQTAGEANNRHYNVSFRTYEKLHHPKHASLHCTALRSELLDQFEKIVKAGNEKQLDKRWWQFVVHEPDISRHLAQVQQFSLGIKGLPGRAGYSSRHRLPLGHCDADLAVLRAWIGDDADAYARFKARGV